MSDCQHNFQFYKNESYRQEVGHYGIRFVSIDHFACTKCLKTQEVKKEHVSNNLGDRDQIPGWSLLIKNHI